MVYQDLGYRHRNSRSAYGRTFIPRPEGFQQRGDDDEPVITKIEHSNGYWATHQTPLLGCGAAMAMGLLAIYLRLTLVGAEEFHTAMATLMATAGAVLIFVGLLYPALLFARHRRLKRALTRPAGEVPPAE